MDELLPTGQRFPSKYTWNEEDVPTREPLTVAQLREAIRDLPDDMLISLEGCDCVGKCYGYNVERGENVLELERQ